MVLGTHGGRNGYVGMKSGLNRCPREWEKSNGIKIAVLVPGFQVHKS